MSKCTDIGAQVQCVKRELGFRIRVYARRVSEGKMAQGKADYEIACMKAVLATLEEIERQSNPQPELLT